MENSYAARVALVRVDAASILGSGSTVAKSCRMAASFLEEELL